MTCPTPVMTHLDELEYLRRENARLQGELDRSRAEQARLQDALLHPQRIEATGTFAAGLAHDMNNVLAAIMSYCDILLDHRHPPQVQADLEQIVEQAERGAGLTRSLLAFSRKGQYRKQVLELDKLNRDALRMLSHTLPKSVEIRSQLDARARVEVDPVQLTQVLVNLGLNAADAMGGKGAIELLSDLVELDDITARTLGVASGSHARLRFADAGCGMDAVTCQRIFEPFFTTKPIGKGTGLGLALVWGVIKGHNGSVTVQSALGHGTTFTIHLPTTTAALPVKAMSRTGRSAPTTTTILVVDDEPAIRQGTRRILERTGFKVIDACNGEDAIEQLARNVDSVGLVILDMAMPVMGGAECFQRLREASKVPVLIATGYALDQEVQSLVAQGAAVVEKPYPAAELVVEITRLLDQSKPGNPGHTEVEMPVIGRKTRVLRTD